MKAINRAIDRFCYKHPRFGIPNLMLYVVIGNALVYIISQMDTTHQFLYYLYFSPSLILRGEIWRLFTFIFVPSTSGMLWLAIFLYFYYFIGSTLEREWGIGKFTIYYLSGILLTIIYCFIVGLITGAPFLAVDASYINLSMFFAFAVLFPETRVLLFFIIPLKIKYLAILDAVFFGISIITNPFPMNLLPLVAIANFFIFCGEQLFRPLKSAKSGYSKTSINFRRNVQQAKYEQSSMPYKHKCAVCGRTDTDFPDLEFRYCSRCSGYHCFCQDHINNHVHFTE